MLITARYVVPVDAPSIEDGGVLIRDGRIAEVGRASQMLSPSRIDYGDAVILPGLVNAHTHLELSFLAGRISPSMGFVPWIRGVAQNLLAPPPSRDTIEESVREGIRQSLAAGVTAVGDITRWPELVRPVLATSALRAISFGEVIGIGAGKNCWRARLELAASTALRSARLRIGISPHSPYTVELDGLRACAARAREQDLPVCIHVAETADEENFTRRLEGPLKELLQSAGVWDDNMTPAGLGPVELCAAAGLLGPATVLGHANYVSDDDIATIARSGASVVYCPRTHAAFGHKPHRFRDMLRADVNVCIGTDSLASNPSLSMLDELRFLHANHPDLSSDDILAMGTLRGAKALGIDGDAGSLTVGKSADLAVVPLAATMAGWEGVMGESTSPSAVYVGGRHTSLLG